MSIKRTVPQAIDRRAFLGAGAASLAASAAAASAPVRADAKATARGKPTKFQVACMTYVYSPFPFERALSGLQSVGYRFVALGTNHREPGGKPVPILAPDATPERARDIGKKCRDHGLEPVMMFSGVYPDSPTHMDVMKNRIRQAAAAGIAQLLTFGNPDPKKSDRKRWIEHFKALGQMAHDQGVLIVIKQHGGITANGAMTLSVVQEVDNDNVKINYDSGNVMDYLHVDPAAVAADIQACASAVCSFCIKDHRRFPKDEDCGPGLGEIDHYRLLAPVAWNGRPIPLCCENIFAPVLPRPSKPEGTDAFARRAREFLELVVEGVQAPEKKDS